MRRTTCRRADPPPSPCRWSRCFIALCLGLSLQACAGGSGSSGFDAVAENNAINQALGSQGCEMNGGLTICASGGATSTPAVTSTLALATRTATPTRTGSPTAPPTGTSTPLGATVTHTPLPTSSFGPSKTPTLTTTPEPLPPPATATLAASPAGSSTMATTPTPTGSPGFTLAPTRTTTLPPSTFTVAATAANTPADTASRTPTATGTHPPTSTAVPTSTQPEAPSFTPTPTATPAHPSIDTNIDSSDTLPCRQEGPGQPCVFVFTFQPHAAPADAAYRVAVRTRNPDSAWLIVPVTDDSASIVVNATPSARRYQLAVLLFVQDPGFVPDRVNLLADSGADFAFVTPLLTPEALAE